MRLLESRDIDYVQISVLDPQYIRQKLSQHKNKGIFRLCWIDKLEAGSECSLVDKPNNQFLASVLGRIM